MISRHNFIHITAEGKIPLLYTEYGVSECLEKRSMHPTQIRLLRHSGMTCFLVRHNAGTEHITRAYM